MALSPTSSSLLLIGVLGIVALAVALLLSTVLLPQGTSALVLVFGAGVFLAVQLAMFKLLRLRSAADDLPRTNGDAASDGRAEAEGDEASEDKTEAAADWRAWRG